MSKIKNEELAGLYITLGFGALVLLMYIIEWVG